MGNVDPLRVPAAMRARHDAIVSATDAFCAAHLNDEYADLCRRLSAALGRKRPSPLATGEARSWAAGIVYALGQVNFLFDKSNEPYIAAAELCSLLGVSQGTASRRAKDIRDRLGLFAFHPDWTLHSLMAENPLAWLVELDNGMIMDARALPRELQEEAFQLGLIPYVP